MFKDYYQVRDWLETFIPLVWGKEELGLVRIEHLLKLLGNPQRKFKSIHIAGTSGKGSTAFYTARLLAESGLKVGLHISPHLVDIRERMQINGELIPMKRFLRLFSEIKLVVEKIKKEKPELTPSYFEILAAASFLHFAKEKVDFAVVEVGLGGRLDATNVLMSEVSIITNIGLDHTEILGKTIEAIAGEKAGIIKAGVPVITGASGKALRVIEKAARERGSKLIKVSTQKGPMGNLLLAKTVVDLLSLRAKRSNLKREGDSFASLRMTSGRLVMTDQGLPGRFEVIENGPTSPKGLRGVNVILDGAHNPDKIGALIDFVWKYQIPLRFYSGQANAKYQKDNILRAQREVSDKFSLRSNNIILVLAFKKGKKWKRMVDLLVKNLPVKQIIATEFNAVTDTGPPSPKASTDAKAMADESEGQVNFAAVPAEEIVKYVDSRFKMIDVGLKKNSQEAVFETLQSTIYNPKSKIILITGSLYLVGEVRTIWELPSFA